MDFKIEVNNNPVSVHEGETLLVALRRNGFKVPTLCHMNRFSPTGACRLCVVEVEGKRDLITSCSYPVEKNMKVKTNSPRVIKARKALVELLLSNHPDDCLYCQRNGNCELQWLAEEMNVKERKFFGEKNADSPDHSSTSVFRDPGKCVLCSRCVRMCEEVQKVTAIDFISRANQTKVNSAFHKGLNVSSCINCGQCIMVCPTGALLDISHLEKIQAELESDNKEVLFFLSPSTVASVAEQVGLKSQQDVTGMINTALKKCGVNKVFNLGFACDINILEETALLNEHMATNPSMPMISSCCPAWVQYLEEFRTEWLPFLARSKSPQQIFGNLLKTHYTNSQKLNPDQVFSVAVMPCVGKKFEASREEMTHQGISEVDAVLTVRELFRLLRTFGIDLRSLKAGQLDTPFEKSSASAWKMGYSGGKAEAIALELYKMKNNGNQDGFKFSVSKNLAGKKETKLKAGNEEFGFAWTSGIEEADTYLQQLLEENRTDIQYLEVMGCPGGCAGGGGQPISRNPEKPKNRKKFCQEMVKISPIKSAGENPFVLDLYKNKDASPGSEKIKDWFHTHFRKREVMK